MGACFVFLGAGAAILLTTLPSPVPRDEGGSRSHPNLFHGDRRCRSRRNISTQADRMARRGRMLAERYPYDPGDGIRAASRLLEAEHCYRLAGKKTEARRIHRLTNELVAKIDADYASARLILEHALKSKRWSLASAEAERLLALTAHLGPDAYVEWLRDISGKVAALAEDLP